MPVILGRKGGGSGGGAPSGAAGGDLGGTYPNPTVDIVDDAVLGSGAAAATTVLTGDRAWTAIATVTAVTLSTTLPGGPVDGQEVDLTDNTTTPTYVWRMKYKSSNGLWYFVGGSNKNVNVTTQESTSVSLSVWMALTTPVSFTTPYAGVYDIHFGCQVNRVATANNEGQVGISINNADPTGGIYYADLQMASNAVSQVSVSARDRFTVGTAGHTLSHRYRSFAAHCSYTNRFMSLAPFTLTP